ncbi:MAG: GatB/YqeY domain-containing protein [Pseudomonadota bacterium]
MRDQLNDALKAAIKGQQKRKASTLRLINAAIKDRDIARRGDGEGRLPDEGIIDLLAKMVKQREESTRIYEEAGRLDAAAQETEEIEIIRSFMPAQISEDEANTIIDSMIDEAGAASMRDMGKVMGLLKSKFPGQIDAGKAAARVKQRLVAQASQG